MEKIKSEAMVLVKAGNADSAFERRSVELPAPQKDEVVVESEAFGLNYADVMARLVMRLY